MTALVTADWHLSDNPRDAYRFQGLETIRTIAHIHRVQQIIVLGDLTEEKDEHQAWLVNRVVEQLELMTRSDRRVYVLRGNHDYRVVDSPFFGFVDYLPAVTWINAPRRFPIRDLGNCLFLPHTANYKRDWARETFTGNDWIFCHNTFDGALSEAGQKLDGIPPSIFPDVRHLVISGDVHSPQRLGPITYVGAPYTVDFGDDYEPRVLILEPGKPPKSVRVTGPQKRLIKTGTKLPRGAEINAGDLVEVRVQLEAGEFADWARIRQAVAIWVDERGGIVHAIRPVAPTKNQAKAINRRDPRTDEQLLAAYGKRMSVDERTLKTGAFLLQKAG